MNKGFKKTLNSILNVITTVMIVILFFAIISNFQTNFMGKKYNSFFGYTLFEIKTASMAGFTEIGDWVLVKETKNVSLNDVITFEEDGSFVTHRIIQIYNDTYVTKGDSNNSEDVPVSGDQIVGVVVKVLPKFAFIKKTLLNTKVIILFLIAIVLGHSIFVKDDSENNMVNKVRKMLNLKPVHKNNNKNNNNKQYNKQNIVYKDIQYEKKDDNDIRNNKDNIYENYPNLSQLESVDDPSKTVVLSKITVNKSKTVDELKNLINENANIKNNNINYEKSVKKDSTKDSIPGIIEL